MFELYLYCCYLQIYCSLNNEFKSYMNYSSCIKAIRITTIIIILLMVIVLYK